MTFAIGWFLLTVVNTLLAIVEHRRGKKLEAAVDVDAAARHLLKPLEQRLTIVEEQLAECRIRNQKLYQTVRRLHAGIEKLNFQIYNTGSRPLWKPEPDDDPNSPRLL